MTKEVQDKFVSTSAALLARATTKGKIGMDDALMLGKVVALVAVMEKNTNSPVEAIDNFLKMVTAQDDEAHKKGYDRQHELVKSYFTQLKELVK